MQALEVPTTTFSPKVRWWTDSEWFATYDRFLTPDKRPNADRHRILDRRFTLQAFAASVCHLRGASAECGVYRGTASALICATLQGTYDGAKHHGFDSFKGLPEVARTMLLGKKGNWRLPMQWLRHTWPSFPASANCTKDGFRMYSIA